MADKPDDEAIKAAVDVLSKVDPAKLQQLGLNAQATGAQATGAQATGAQALTKEFLEAIQLLTVGKDRELLIKRFGDEAGNGTATPSNITAEQLATVREHVKFRNKVYKRYGRWATKVFSYPKARCSACIFG